MEEAMDSSGPSVTEIRGILLAMQKNLECPICLETMKAPVSAHCAHVFCRFCILKLLEQKKGIAKCPLCNGNISKSTLQEDVRFKLVIKGVLEAIGALECDTGVSFVGDQCPHKKAVETTSAAVLQEEPTIVESKGYRGRRNGVKKAEKRNSTLQCKSSHLPLPNRTVTRSSLRKKSHSNKTVCFEVESDSSGDLFQKTCPVRRVGLRSSSRSLDGERCAQKRSRSPCHVAFQELNGEDVVLSGTPDARGLSEAGPGCTEGIGARSRDSVKENAVVEESTKRSQLLSEATDPDPNQQAGNKAEMVSKVQPAGSAQVHDLTCEDEQELQQPQAPPKGPLSQLSGKTLIQSIQKVNEWFSKSKVFSPAPLQDVNAEEGDPDLNSYLSDADSHVFQKTEPREDQWEVAAGCQTARPWSKPAASRMVDKIFGRRYGRTRKSNPICNERETVRVPAAESCTAVNAESCDTPIRKIPALKKATQELSLEVVMKEQTAMEESEGAGGNTSAVLEEDGRGLAVVGGTPGAVQRPAELSVKEGVSGFEPDASPICCQSCNSQNLKRTRNSLSNRSRRPGRPVCALQLAMQCSSGSPEKTKAQEGSNPGNKEAREASTDQTPVRRSKRLLSWAEGEQKGSEPGKKRRKQLDEGEQKRQETQAGHAPPWVAEGGPSIWQGMAGDASKAFPDGQGSLSVECPTERDSLCGIVPDATSQGSCLPLQYHLAEGEQSDRTAEEFSAVPQAEYSALCAQAPERKSPRACDEAVGDEELNSETDDSELDAVFMGKMFRCCKRKSFLLHPAPSKKPAAGTQTELSIGRLESSEANRGKISAPGTVGEERKEAAASRVANGSAGLSLVPHPPHSCDRGSGSKHLRVVPQAFYPNNSCMPVAAKEAESGNPLQSQKPASGERESSEMGETSNTRDCSRGSSGLWRSGKFRGTSLPLADETSSNTAQFLETRPESDRNKTLACSFCSELIQPFPVARQLWPSESRRGSMEKECGVGEQKPLKGPGEQTVQMLSTGVSEGHSEQSARGEIPVFSLLSDTPEGLLGPATESNGCSLNPREVDQQETSTVFAKTDQGSPLEEDLECSSSSSGSMPEGLAQACRRRVQKLSSSSDDELPCFQALVFGRSASTPSQPRREEEEASAEILAQRGSSRSSPKSQGEGGSPSQESEDSMNLFSSESRASEDSTRKACDTRPLTPLPTSQGKVMTPRTATGQLRDGHRDCINAEPKLGEALGDDSEFSHLGDSSGFSSQSEMLTTQQKDAMQNNLKKLQQEMAVLEAALKEGGQGASAEGLPLPCEESVFAGGQTCSAREHISYCLATKPERGSSVAIQDISSAPEHESQGRPVSPFAATTTICSGRKENSKSLLWTSKRSMMSLVTSRLFPDELQLIQKFARETESTWSNTFSEDTTHVIMRTDEDLVCERTLKYFLGIAARKWVVSYEWVLQSLKEGRVLNEGDFEVRGDVDYGRNHQGPKRAREPSTGKLFQGLEICCYGPFTGMQREQLEWMVELCGASLVKQPHLFSCSAVSDSVVVIQPDAWVEDSGGQGIPPPCSAIVVARDWVLDSLSCYQRLTFEEYIVQQP
uniref:breast cancer type 1 susceptibility protein homolog n=1 Tax=Euleptes europaea TaxID=460621 RepID=UPI002540A5F7|nr:breast cancer type 1 susceptibility protein homolog [Euleptes europaea]